MSMAFGEGIDTEMARSGLLDSLSDSQLQRALAQYGLTDAFGGRQREIDQARSDAPYANIDWLQSILSGNRAGDASLPVGGTSTQTQTTPGVT